MKRIFIALISALLLPLLTVQKAQAQTCAPVAVFSYIKDGEPVEETTNAYSGPAPVTAHFTANPSGDEGFTAIYEWWIYPSSSRKEQWIAHYSGEQYAEMEYTFMQSGTFDVALKVTFTNTTDGSTVDYPDPGEHVFKVTVQESKLEMPNAFSPNGDGYNDVYRAKPNHQSIVEFKATIYNRWGQKIYSWDDVNGSWDGTVNGRTVESGVFYVNVVAKGADGVEYKIRKDVNILTRYKEKDGTDH